MTGQGEMIGATEVDMATEESTIRGIWPDDGAGAQIFTERGIAIGSCTDGDRYLLMVLIAGQEGGIGVLGEPKMRVASLRTRLGCNIYPGNLIPRGVMDEAKHGFGFPWTLLTLFNGQERGPLKDHPIASRVSEKSRLIEAHISVRYQCLVIYSCHLSVSHQDWQHSYLRITACPFSPCATTPLIPNANRYSRATVCTPHLSDILGRLRLVRTQLEPRKIFFRTSDAPTPAVKDE